MNETVLMENLDDIQQEPEIIYSEDELDGIYRAYEERVIKKAMFKMWCKEFLK